MATAGLGTTAGGAVITAGRSVVGLAATTPGAPTGGRAITGPTGGLLAMAGGAGGATMFAPCRGRGTIRRGAGGVVEVTACFGSADV